MRSSRIIRNLSTSLLNSSVVVPVLVQSAFNQTLTKNLNALQSLEAPCINTITWLFRLLDVSIATQILSQESLTNVTFQDSNRETVEEYLQGNVALLDTCNGLLGKVDNIGKYVELVRIAIHSLESCNFDQPINPIAFARAKQGLKSCECFERQCREMMMIKSKSGLTKLSVKLTQYCMSSQNTSTRKHQYSRTEVLDEILSGSSIVTTMLSDTLSVALSFNLKHKLKYSTQNGSSTWLCHELHELKLKIKEEKENHKGSNLFFSDFRKIVTLTQYLSQKLQSPKQDEVTMIVAELKRSCEEVDEGLKSLEGKIKELYRFLISIRMSLLGRLSSLQLA